MLKQILVLIIIIMFMPFLTRQNPVSAQETFWEFQSIDTMKYSRDLAREKLNDPSLNATIEKQTQQIADTGATHIAIATPYDAEFLPFLYRWVTAARRHNLQVWFRGNWSGWEGWFEYDRIDRAAHQDLTHQFIVNNPDLFADGDVFTACPECENGGPGDPRFIGDADGHRQFLIDEYHMTTRAFQEINKDVTTTFNSMNGDVARLIMDKETTNALGGVVVIDHYVASPEQLAFDIHQIANASGGAVVLGEFGAPIPDITGSMTDEEQAEWLDRALQLLVKEDRLAGLNYWVNTGGSTELWPADDPEKQGVNSITRAYSPQVYSVYVKDNTASSVSDARVVTSYGVYATDHNGYDQFPGLNAQESIVISAYGFEEVQLTLTKPSTKIELKRSPSDMLNKLIDMIHRLFNQTNMII